MILANDLAKAVEGLALTITGYKTGKIGKSGLCDCIGLIIGAMMQLGHGSYPMRSTNYFARKEMDSLETIGDVTPEPGLLVYKAREDGGELHGRYSTPGERYYTGDLLDYYHVGVVTAVEPLEITHCTSVAGGIKRDASLAGWTHAGRLNGVVYTTDTSAEVTGISAVVAAANGKPVRMRAVPDDDGDTLAKLPVGESVTVLADAQGWAKIRTAAGKIGYMMSEFLTSGQPAPTGSMVTIRLERDAAEAAMAALGQALKGGGDA